VDHRLRLDHLGGPDIVVLVEEQTLDDGGVARENGGRNFVGIRDHAQPVGVVGGRFVSRPVVSPSSHVTGRYSEPFKILFK